MEKIDLVVPPESAGERLDKWLASSVPDTSRTRISKLIKEGFIDGLGGASATDVSRKVAAGEQFTLTLVPRASKTPPQPENIPLSILYEDDDIIVIDKPSGMVVHRGNGVEGGTLVNALLHHTGGRLSTIGAEAGRMGLVHRRDKDTSGAMVACKTDRAHIAMYKMFEKHEVKRDYTALVWGRPVPAAGTIDKHIARNPRIFDRMKVVSEGGRAAITHYETRQVFPHVSLLRLALETGRTHQIRVHMRSTGTPVLGDKTYGQDNRFLKTIENSEEKRLLIGAKRQMLHSANISFTHPILGAEGELEAPMPADMARILSGLYRLK